MLLFFIFSLKVLVPAGIMELDYYFIEWFIIVQVSNNTTKSYTDRYLL